MSPKRNARRDGNFVPTLIGVDSVLFLHPVNVAVNEETGAVVTEPSMDFSGFTLPDYDYFSMALFVGNTIETYTFKTGGASGTTVATVSITYTTSDRDVIQSGIKTTP